MQRPEISPPLPRTNVMCRCIWHAVLLWLHVRAWKHSHGVNVNPPERLDHRASILGSGGRLGVMQPTSWSIERLHRLFGWFPSLQTYTCRAWWNLQEAGVVQHGHHLFYCVDVVRRDVQPNLPWEGGGK